MGKNKNEKKPKSAQKTSFTNDQLGENAGYDKQTQANTKNKTK